MGVSTGDIMMVDNNQWYTISLTEYGVSAAPYSIKFDTDNNLWVGTGYGGTLCFTHNGVFHYDMSNSGIGSDGITDIEITDDTVWFATLDNGVTSWCNQDEWNSYSTTSSNIGSNKTMDIAIDSNKTIWSTTHRGISHYYNNRWVTYTTDNSIVPSDTSIVIEVDKIGRKWVSFTDGSLLVFSDMGGKYEVFSKSTIGYKIGYITAIFTDYDNDRVWVGTTNGKLFCYHQNTWEEYDSTNSNMPNGSNIIYSITKDLDNNIWIGTEYSGVVEFIEQ